MGALPPFVFWKEIFMFEVVETFLIQFINILPYVIPLILIMNLVSHLLWGDRWWKYMFRIIRLIIRVLSYKMAIPYACMIDNLPRIVLYLIAITILIQTIYTKTVHKLLVNTLHSRLACRLVRLVTTISIEMILIRYLSYLLFC